MEQAVGNKVGVVTYLNTNRLTSVGYLRSLYSNCLNCMFTNKPLHRIFVSVISTVSAGRSVLALSEISTSVPTLFPVRKLPSSWNQSRRSTPN